VFDETALFLGRPEAAVPRLEPVLPRRPLRGRRILLVDDDTRNIFALRAVLEPQGMDILPATTGREALDRLERDPVDLVLMDIMLPGMDGFETIRAIRGNPARGGCPSSPSPPRP